MSSPVAEKVVHLPALRVKGTVSNSEVAEDATFEVPDADFTFSENDVVGVVLSGRLLFQQINFVVFEREETTILAVLAGLKGLPAESPNHVAVFQPYEQQNIFQVIDEIMERCMMFRVESINPSESPRDEPKSVLQPLPKELLSRIIILLDNFRIPHDVLNCAGLLPLSLQD